MEFYSKQVNLTSFKNFKLDLFKMTSSYLKKNPLKDSPVRSQLVLSPLKKSSSCIFVLPAFGSKIGDFIHSEFPKKSFCESLDRLVSLKKAPLSHYVFVDGMSCLGGSQLLDSPFTGNYETYFMKEVYAFFKKHFKLKKIALSGVSSGAYSSFYLASKYPKDFPLILGISPDSYFRKSLLCDLYKAYPLIQSYGGFSKTLSLIKKNPEKIKSFEVFNSVAMLSCYQTKKWKKNLLPFDGKGNLKEKQFKEIEKKDLIDLLEKRKAQLKKLKKIYLFAGDKDEFFLQYGARKIQKILKKNKIKHHYSEFSGGHRSLHKRLLNYLTYLKKDL